MTRSGRDAGKALACATFVELRKRYGDVFYWRGAGEVDFVIPTGAGPTPVQVTLQGARDRHAHALEDFYEAFPHAAEAVTVTLDNFPGVLGALQAAD